MILLQFFHFFIESQKMVIREIRTKNASGPILPTNGSTIYEVFDGPENYNGPYVVICK